MLAEHLRTTIVRALESIPEVDRPDIYVVSLFVYDTDDDPRRPTISVGFNTEHRVAECTPAAGQKPKWPIASDAAEARWNYAFWLQRPIAYVCDEGADPDGAALLLSWAKKLGFWFADEDEERDFDAAMERVGPLTGEFVRIAVEVVRGLHGANEIARIFGRPIPVIIHELEYYDAIADQNEDANPHPLVEGFVTWVRDP